MSEWEERAAFLETAVREAGVRLLGQTPEITRHKTANDLLTENDVRTEEFLVERILREDPAAHIISEESYAGGELEGRCYVIDPIDGTCNYAVRLPLFGIQVACFEGGTAKASVLHYPSSGDTMSAIEGRGTRWNGAPISVDRTKKAGDGMLIISDYYGDLPIPMRRQFALVEALQPRFLKTRHFGAACVDFALLARGNALAYITYYSHIWDIAPGLLAAKEAGCVFAAVDGSPYRYGEAGLVVANSEETLETVLGACRKLG